tara:strand:- start:1099 stop:2277 length:1179 start_codon:yes stop_codon:yes gene_type:complete
VFVVVLGLSWQQRKSILALKKNKYKIIGVDQDKNSVCKNLVTKFLNIDFIEVDRVFLALRKITKNPKYIFSFNSDAALVPSAKLRNKFNISGLSINQSILMTNKEKLKFFLQKNEFYISKFIIYDRKKKFSTKFKSLKFPCIFKPTVGSGSKNIQIIKSKTEFNNIIDTNKFFDTNRIIVEEFIEGDEYSVEAFILDHKIKILSISKRRLHKKITAKEIFTKKLIEKKYHIIKKTVKRFINLTNINNSPFHLEIILTKKNRVYIVDAAARGGGYYVADYLVLKNANFDINKTLIDIALKKSKVDFDNIKKNQYFVYIKYIISKTGIIRNIKKPNLTKSNKIKFISFKKIGDNSTKHNCDSDRLGAIIGYDKNMKILRNKIHKCYHQTFFDIH